MGQDARSLDGGRGLACLPGQTVICGWDNPLQTYFRTERAAGDRETEDPVVLWLGLDEREVRAAEALVVARATATGQYVHARA